MKKLKLASFLSLGLVLVFNLANASTNIIRNASVGGATGTYNIQFGTETKGYTYDLQQQTFTANLITSKGLGSINDITVTIEGVSITHSFFLSSTTAAGSVVTSFTAPEFDFPTYGYGVAVYYNGAGALSYTVTKFLKP